MVISGIMGVVATSLVGLLEKVAMPWRSTRRGKSHKPAEQQ
jgi:hypothetical protein